MRNTILNEYNTETRLVYFDQCVPLESTAVIYSVQ
jgi:hypothetical protein